MDAPDPKHLLVMLNRQWRLTHATLDEMRKMKERQDALEGRLARSELRLRVTHWTVVGMIWVGFLVLLWDAIRK